MTPSLWIKRGTRGTVSRACPALRIGAASYPQEKPLVSECETTRALRESEKHARDMSRVPRFVPRVSRATVHDKETP
jgi:hypothetical protein